MAWSPTISYNDFVTAVQHAYSGASNVTWSEVSQSLARGGCTTDNYLQYLEQYPSAVDIVKNADGSIRAARINPYASIYDSAGWEAASSAGSYNSNLVPAVSGSGSQAVVTVPGNAVVQQGSTSLTFTQGLSAAGNFVMKEVVPAVAAAGIGIKLGKAIDGAIYNIGTALDLNPPESLNPETWDSITSGDDSLSARLFNMVFDIKPDGTSQAYIDQDAFAYMAQWLATQNFFGGQSYIVDYDEYYDFNNIQLLTLNQVRGLVYNFLSHVMTSEEHPNQSEIYTFWEYLFSNISDIYNPSEDVLLFEAMNNGDYSIYVTSFKLSDMIAYGVRYYKYQKVTFSGLINGYYDTIAFYDANKQQISGTIPRQWKGISAIWQTETSSYDYGVRSSGGGTYNFGTLSNLLRGLARSTSFGTFWYFPMTDGASNYIVNKPYVIGSTLYPYSESTVPDGVTNQPNSQLPDTSTWTSPQATLDSLRQQYPELFQDEVTNTVVQPDGTVRKYHYIPIGMPERDGSTGTQTQQDTQVNPDDSTQTLIDFITQILTQVTPVTDPQTEPDSDTDSPTGTDNPPDTGDGDTPIVPPVTGSASSLWKIYNPSQSEIDAFGAWLWSSDFIDQIKKLFNDPMQAIIGVHKVFCSPSIGGTTTIKCGYLDSEVSSNWVSDQYTHIDCGTVQLPEYFGNVFDYDPFTRVSIFIPCVGIVPLDVAEVMRASINVKLHCDVLTGAMLAEVYVNRDGAGGNLYTYSGSCIVTYPVSSGTYIGAVANVVATAASVTAGIMGTVATGGALAPAVIGGAGAAVSGLSHTHTNVQHSGAFSGAAGVMGGKIPYLIITRPQTRMAQSYESYDGVPANFTSRLGACSGYVKVKEVHLKVPNAYKSELEEIESMLYSGILI